MKKFSKIVMALGVTLGIVSAFALTSAVPTYADAGAEISKGVSVTGADNGKGGLAANIKIVVNVLLFLIGAISVIVIIVGGIKFITSDGDASKIKSARETILYAVVGIIIALLAYAIVDWVVGVF